MIVIGGPQALRPQSRGADAYLTRNPSLQCRSLNRPPGSVPLLGGLRRSVECRVVGRLVLVGADHSEATVEAAVVVPVDPAGGGVFDVGDGLVRAVVEDRRADAFGFVESADRRHQCVIECVTDRADRGRDLLEREVFGQHQRRAMRAGMAVKSNSD